MLLSKLTQRSYFRPHIGGEKNLNNFCKIWSSHSAVAENPSFIKRYSLSLGKYGLRVEESFYLHLQGQAVQEIIFVSQQYHFSVPASAQPWPKNSTEHKYTALICSKYSARKGIGRLLFRYQLVSLDFSMS